MGNWQELIPQPLRTKYNFYNFNHAIEILTQSYPVEFSEILSALDFFSISISDIKAGGGNESAIPKKLASYLHPLGWHEEKITGDLLVKLH